MRQSFSNECNKKSVSELLRDYEKKAMESKPDTIPDNNNGISGKVDEGIFEKMKQLKNSHNKDIDKDTRDKHTSVETADTGRDTKVIPVANGCGLVGTFVINGEYKPKVNENEIKKRLSDCEHMKFFIDQKLAKQNQNIRNGNRNGCPEMANKRGSLPRSVNASSQTSDYSSSKLDELNIDIADITNKTRNAWQERASAKVTEKLPSPKGRGSQHSGKLISDIKGQLQNGKSEQLKTRDKLQNSLQHVLDQRNKNCHKGPEGYLKYDDFQLPKEEALRGAYSVHNGSDEHSCARSQSLSPISLISDDSMKNEPNNKLRRFSPYQESIKEFPIRYSPGAADANNNGIVPRNNSRLSDASVFSCHKRQALGPLIRDRIQKMAESLSKIPKEKHEVAVVDYIVSRVSTPLGSRAGTPIVKAEVHQNDTNICVTAEVSHNGYNPMVKIEVHHNMPSGAEDCGNQQNELTCSVITGNDNSNYVDTNGTDQQGFHGGTNGKINDNHINISRCSSVVELRALTTVNHSPPVRARPNGILNDPMASNVYQLRNTNSHTDMCNGNNNRKTPSPILKPHLTPKSLSKDAATEIESTIDEVFDLFVAKENVSAVDNNDDYKQRQYRQGGVQECIAALDKVWKMDTRPPYYQAPDAHNIPTMKLHSQQRPLDIRFLMALFILLGSRVDIGKQDQKSRVNEHEYHGI